MFAHLNLGVYFGALRVLGPFGPCVLQGLGSAFGTLVVYRVFNFGGRLIVAWLCLTLPVERGTVGRVDLVA